MLTEPCPIARKHIIKMRNIDDKQWEMTNWSNFSFKRGKNKGHRTVIVWGPPKERLRQV